MKTILLVIATLLWTAQVAADDAAEHEWASFLRGQGGKPIFQQDETQMLCSGREAPPLEVTRRLEARALQNIPKPPGGQYLGQVSRGQMIAYGTTKAAGNCVGCHRLQASDVAYGTMGPDLLGYGRNKRPEDHPRLWAQLYDAKAFHLCSAMPRFGTQHILTDTDLQDVMSFLLAPDSPVNQ
jgi:sulfur-oxidizing protein SoxX